MKEMVERFKNFRENVYAAIRYRADAAMNLIDSLASNLFASSPVQLSLSPLFPRQSSSIHDAVDNFSGPKKPATSKTETCEAQTEICEPQTPDMPDTASEAHREQQIKLTRVVADLYPDSDQRNFKTIVIDRTTLARLFSLTLEDRGYQYSPNPCPGNKPIVVGHSYQVLAALPEKGSASESPWVLPLSAQRVPTDKKGTDIAVEQITDILNDEAMPFGGKLCVVTGDTEYSAVDYLGRVCENENLVNVVRVSANRVFYREFSGPVPKDKRGPKPHYGEDFRLGDPETHHKPDSEVIVPCTFKNGRQCQATVTAWQNMLMKGKKGIRMHPHPFTLLRIIVRDADGNEVFERPLWLIIIGKRRDEIRLADAYDVYRQRFDIEHFFRFGKKRLMMSGYQTPEVEHEENWVDICCLAYANLYAAAPLASQNCNPWERWLPENKNPDPNALPSPSAVQRDLTGIIQRFGTPAEPPKPRVKSPGRQKGESPGKRKRIPVVKKGSKTAQPNEESIIYQ